LVSIETTPGSAELTIRNGQLGPFSFRDPGGVLVRAGERLFRIVNDRAAADLQVFLSSKVAGEFDKRGALVKTTSLDADETVALLGADEELRRVYESYDGRMVLEHERIPFPSFPYEWPAEMLHAAASLTVELALAGLPEGIGIKDATPLNVLFRGPAPVFVDVLSFEQRERRDPTWLAYAQYQRTFALPLLAWKHMGLSPDQIFPNRRDGLEPEEVYKWLGFGRRLRPGCLQMVSMPTWLGKRQAAQDTTLYKRKLSDNPEKAQFIVKMLLNGLRRSLAKLRPKSGAHSAWSEYATANSYSTEEADTKRAFVSAAVAEHSPARVLDVGCNTGRFSMIAARAGASVVAIDYDPVVVGALWAAAHAERLDILPLVVNFARPTPATGWRNEEFPSFLERARGRFDAVLMLAVLHHLLVTERLPLDSVLRTAAELTTNILVIEFVGTDDPMFRTIARGRDALHADLTPASFEAAAEPYFELLLQQAVKVSSRILYLFRKKGL
jgi:2-polyprenyl-3-methyl-5-hydroxy-6-metoxy-1,4-benzoquinol methylase